MSEGKLSLRCAVGTNGGEHTQEKSTVFDVVGHQNLGLNLSVVLGTFSKLRKTTISFMSVCPHAKIRLPLDRFS